MRHAREQARFQASFRESKDIMPISAEQWRVSIGLCYTCIPVVSRNVVRCRYNDPWSIFLDLLLTPFMILTQWWSGGSRLQHTKDKSTSNSFSVVDGVRYLHRKTIETGCVCMCASLAIFLMIIIASLLMRSGNVERNPGPVDRLVLKDLVHVRRALWDTCANWEDVGLELNIDPATLAIIKADNSDTKSRFTAMLTEWLKQTSPQPTWSALVTALEQPTVGFSHLAEEIKQKYIVPPSCIESESGASVSQNPPEQQSPNEMIGATASNNDVSQSRTDSERGRDLVTSDGQHQQSSVKDQPIQVQVKCLQDEFKKLVVRAEKDLKTRKVDVDDFVTTMTVVHYEIREQHKEFFEKHFLKLEKGTTIHDVLRQLHFYWDFLNYTLLQEIIDNFGNEHLKKDMSAYVTSLQQFRKSTRVCEFVEYLPKMGARAKPPCTELQEFVVKNKRVWEKCTLEDLEQLKVMITHRFLLPEFTLILKEITEGCVSITWLVPSSIARVVREDIENIEDREFFKVHQIDLITINGQECYYSPVKKYAAYLRGVYSSKEEKNLAPFKLAKISKKKVSYRNMNSFARSSIRGDIDDVVYEKSPLTEDEIGWICQIRHGRRVLPIPQKILPKLVLIEGAPGVGKTTFSSHFCYKWSQGQVLKEYSLLVLLPLRDNQVRSAETIADLLRHSELQQTVAQEVEKSQGEGVILWLEGFDELDEDLRTKSSIFLDLIQGQILPKATIFVTSRPWASGEIANKFISEESDQHIEILSTPQIQFDRLLRGDKNAALSKQFSDYTSTNVAIFASMHTPITANIAAEVFKWSQKTGSPPPTTMTQLYTTFTLKLLTQHLSGKEELSQWNLRKFDDLPSKDFEQFHSLCELAYNGILRRQLVFSDLPLEFESFGLMNAVKQLHREDHAHQSYNFIHLTIQEYLAAFYISQLSSQEQSALIQKYHKLSHFKMSLRFLAGITHMEHFTPDLTHKLRLKGRLTLFHWLFEAGNASAVTTILGDSLMLIKSSYSWSPVDFYVAGYCLSLSDCSWDLWFSSFLDDDGLTMFSKGVLLNGDANCRGHISHAWFEGSTMIAEGLMWFSQLPQRVLNSLKVLNLSEKKLDKTALTRLAEAIPAMISLEELNIERNPIGNGGAVDLFKSLCTINPPLKKLDLQGTGIGEGNCLALGELLACSSSLTTLYINNVSPDGTTSIMKGLSKNNSLQVLKMKGSQLTLESIAALSSALQRPQCQLRRMDLSNSTITSDLAVQLAEGLASNHSLEDLILHSCSITSHGAVQLALSLTNNSTLRELDVSENLIGPEGPAAFAEMIQVNKSLKELRLHGNESLGEEGIHQLISGLKDNTTLKRLTLPANRLKTEVVDFRISWYDYRER